MTLLVLLTAAAAAEERTGQVVFLCTTDVHGKNPSVYQAAGAWKSRLESEGAAVLLLENGDYLWGDPWVNRDHGASAVEAMNQAGYDVAGLGNHEFEWGTEELQNVMMNAEFSVICANLRKPDTDEPLFAAHTIRELAGHRIGVFGLTTPDVAEIPGEERTGTLCVEADEALVLRAQTEVDTLRASGCDFVVCLGHLGTSGSSKPNRSRDILRQVSGIDLFLDGHSHALHARMLEGTMQVQAGEYGETIGMAVLDTDGQLTAFLLRGTDAYALPEEGECAAVLPAS